MKDRIVGVEVLGVDRFEVLALRGIGLSIAQISNITGYRLTPICQIIHEQNMVDISNDK